MTNNFIIDIDNVKYNLRRKKNTMETFPIHFFLSMVITSDAPVEH